MSTRSKSTTMRDVETGAEYSRYDNGDVTVTTEIAQHPYRALAGKAFVTLNDTVIAAVNDDQWERVLGLRLGLPGGTEVDVDDAELERALEDIEECDEVWEEAVEIRPDLFTGGPDHMELLVPCVVRDGDLPPVRVLVPTGTLRDHFQRAEPGTGTHVDRETKCRHHPKDFGKTKCRGCLRRWWQGRVKELEGDDDQA